MLTYVMGLEIAPIGVNFSVSFWQNGRGCRNIGCQGGG
jgi:hypothetical protein